LYQVSTMSTEFSSFDPEVVRIFLDGEDILWQNIQAKQATRRASQPEVRSYKYFSRNHDAQGYESPRLERADREASRTRKYAIATSPEQSTSSFDPEVVGVKMEDTRWQAGQARQGDYHPAQQGAHGHQMAMSPFEEEERMARDQQQSEPTEAAVRSGLAEPIGYGAGVASFDLEKKQEESGFQAELKSRRASLKHTKPTEPTSVAEKLVQQIKSSQFTGMPVWTSSRFLDEYLVQKEEQNNRAVRVAFAKRQIATEQHRRIAEYGTELQLAKQETEMYRAFNRRLADALEAAELRQRIEEYGNALHEAKEEEHRERAHNIRLANALETWEQNRRIAEWFDEIRRDNEHTAAERLANQRLADQLMDIEKERRILERKYPHVQSLNQLLQSAAGKMVRKGQAEDGVEDFDARFHRHMDGYLASAMFEAEKKELLLQHELEEKQEEVERAANKLQAVHMEEQERLRRIREHSHCSFFDLIHSANQRL